MQKFSELDFRFLYLMGLMIFLPSIEALKNIFAFLFFLSWVTIAIKNKNWGGKWRIIDSIFLMWILAAIGVSLNAINTYQFSGGGLSDILRFILIAWALSRIYFSKKKIIDLALITILATVVSLVFSYYISGELKELHSVGHINHTAIFLLIVFSISSALIVLEFNKFKNYQKTFIILTTIILFLSIVDTDSRAAFGLLTIITFFNWTFLVIKERNSLLTILSIGLIISTIFLFLHNPPEVLKRIQNEQILEETTRSKINLFSYYAFKYSFDKNPLFGIGFGNYFNLEIDDIKPYVLSKNSSFNSKDFRKGAHPHNVYYTYLVNGGLLIFTIFIWFWFYIIWIIFKLLFRKQNEWILLSSISVVLINLGIGMVNTTLHHEHAILSMFVLSLLISKYRMSQLRKELVEI